MRSPAPTRSSRSNFSRSQPLALSDYFGVPFHATVGDLHDFFILAGTSAATLVGLLFVGLSLHLKIVIAASEVPGQVPRNRQVPPHVGEATAATSSVTEIGARVR